MSSLKGQKPSGRNVPPSKPAPPDDDKTVMATGPTFGGAASKASKPPDLPDHTKGMAVLAGVAGDGAAQPPPPPIESDVDHDERTVIVADDLAKPADRNTSPQAFSWAPTQAGTDNTSNTSNTSPPTSETTNREEPTAATNSKKTPSQISQWPGVTGTGNGSKPPTSDGMPEAGMYINQYEIIRKLGEGGMGAVFLARDTRLGRRVAIKFLSSTDPELAKRFVIEARATARVEHENIVSIYEVGEWTGHPFMVLQYLQGQELSKALPRGKKVPVQRVVEVMTPVLRALAYAHGEGIVHRDLKPDNIFITEGGVTKVLDFGIAKVVQGEDKSTEKEVKVSRADLAAMGPDKGLTRSGAVVGTMPYMSPEQWGNGVAIDHTTDIWAVGIIMYMQLAGKHPLAPLSGTELMVTGFLDEAMPSLRDAAPDMPKEVIDLVDRCLQKDKAKRWPDASAVLRAIEPLARARGAGEKALSIEESPYPGLSSFQEEDAGRFFGRNREIAAMSQRLRERPLMGVVGPSGVGKSSFLRAGVVPALKNSGENWDINVIRPGRTPLMALAGLLVHASASTSTSIDDEIAIQQKLAERLAKEPGYLGTALRGHARREKKNLLLFVDQFEELYTLVGNSAERLAFTACLSAAADDPTSPMRVVVSIRSDFLDRCVEDVHFMNELSQGLFFLTAPTREGMREALVQPAQMAGYKFESDDIIDEMLNHLAHTSGALPLLQFTADKLWGERDPSRKVLTTASYKELGGITGALASHADRILEQVTGDQRAIVRAIFLRLVTPDRTRAIVSMDELAEHLGKTGTDVRPIIDLLVQARLLVVQTGGGGSGATVEIVHESLIHGWPQLARWLDEGQEDAVFLEQLRNTSRQWAAKNRDSGLLWRGEMVEEAKRFVRRHRGQLAEAQAQFLKAVIDNSNRAARVKKVIYVTTAIILLAMLAAAGVALYIINESRDETRQAAIVAKKNEELATNAAAEAKAQKVVAEGAKVEAEKALSEAKAAESAKEAARDAERKALHEANMSKEQLADALVESKNNEKKAVQSAREAATAKVIAEQKAREANEARMAATRSADALKVAMLENEKRRKDAEAAKEEALKRLKEMTRGGVVEVLK